MREPPSGIFQGIYRTEEKRSSFLFLCLRTADRERVRKVDRLLRDLYSDADHILMVCRVRDANGVLESAQENGEPVRSAHRMLFELQRRDAGDCALWAIRYYGGKKLGASNLDGLLLDGFERAFQASAEG